MGERKMDMRGVQNCCRRLLLRGVNACAGILDECRKAICMNFPLVASALGLLRHQAFDLLMMENAKKRKVIAVNKRETGPLSLA